MDFKGREMFVNIIEELKDNAIKYLMGQAMKLSRGKANPQMINKLILDKLS